MNTTNPIGLTAKQEAIKRFNSLRNRFMYWQPALMDLSRYVDPTRGIFNGNRSNIGKAIDNKTLLDSHATHAKRITSSGMQTGMTDPARPWYRLTMDSWIIDNVPGVREWVDDIAKRMIDVMNKSNIYRVFQNCYDELVQFGTGCFLILEDFDDVIRGRSFTAGEYYIGTDNKGRVNAFAREFEMTVGQMVKEFGFESCSAQVQAMYKQNQVDNAIKVYHLIEANDTRIEGFQDYKNMPFRSCYWENSDGATEFLAQRGYKYFHVIAPRWDSITTDMDYGYGPSWHGIGDIKQLQTLVSDKLIAEQKVNNPPTVEDSSVIGHSNKMPGGITKISSSVPNSGLRAAYQINPNLANMQNSIDLMHQKIDKHLFADLFLMISSMPVNSNTTAFEIATRKQEQMMMLGPILHGLNEEMHSKSIDIIFNIMNDNGLIPPPPQGLIDLQAQGHAPELKVQYISILAQAQKAMGVQQIESTIAYITQAMQVDPNARFVFDIKESVREVADLQGVDGKLTLSKEDVDAQIQAFTDQQNKMMALQAGTQVADAASKLGKTPGQGSGSMADNLSNSLVGK